MVELFFKATWMPEVKKFHVQFKAQGHTHVEMMTPERYVQFCDSLTFELEVAGWKLQFHTPNGDINLTLEVQNALRKYFRDVRKSYELSLKGHATVFHL